MNEPLMARWESESGTGHHRRPRRKEMYSAHGTSKLNPHLCINTPFSWVKEEPLIRRRKTLLDCQRRLHRTPKFGSNNLSREVCTVKTYSPLAWMHLGAMKVIGKSSHFYISHSSMSCMLNLPSYADLYVFKFPPCVTLPVHVHLPLFCKVYHCART